MRVVGALVFALAAIVNSIVCPGFPAGYYPRDESIPSDYRTLVVTPQEYPGAHFKNQENGNLHLIETPFGVFAKGDIIVSSNFNGRIKLIYNSEGKATIRNIATRTTELFTLERAQELGIPSYIAARARSRARARVQAQEPQDRSNGNSN